MNSKNQTRFLLFLGGRPVLPDGPLVEDTSAATWPFRRHVTPRHAQQDAPAAAIWIRDLHLAFPSGQTAGTRLVLTQSTYQLQRWLDWLDAHPGAVVVADADRDALGAEARAGRGPWSRIQITEDAGRGFSASAKAPAREEAPYPELSLAFTQPDSGRRLTVCQRVVEKSPGDPALLLALASACMELQRVDDARAALERAVTLAPDWEASHFEMGKLWLRMEDTERAATAFAEAARLMPHFATALLNLGGALGELDRPVEALAALHRALDVDPRGHVIRNNIGTVYREQGRLDEAADAFREVIALAPSFVFGYYNLGHTLFLEGEFAGARRAYEEGFERDPQKNPRQACRLAVARVAAQDPEAAIQLVEELGEALPKDRVGELFEEAESTLAALSAIPGVDTAAVSRVLAVLRRYSS